MGDRIAQLGFEKIKTPKIKEVNELEGTDQGRKGYGSIGISAGIKENHNTSTQGQSVTTQDFKIGPDNKEANKPSQLSQA